MSKTPDLSLEALSWRTRLALRRNAIVGNERFQAWAMRWPLFRTVGRRKAAAQFDLVAGFVYSQIVHVFVETGLLEWMREGQRQFAQIAGFVSFEPDACERLLKAGAAIDLVEETQPGLWVLGEKGAALSANAGALAMVRHHALLYRDLGNPIELLRRSRGADTELSRFWNYAGDQTPDKSETSAYSELMAATQSMVWQQIIGRYPFDKHTAMLDIGGGSGAFVEAVGAAHSRLRLGVFDLPDVIPLARSRFAETELERRVSLHPGSFRQDPIPGGYDLVTLVRILHDHDDAVVSGLLRAVYKSLEPGQKLLVVEPMSATRGAKGMGDAYFGLYLWAMGSGRPRSFRENQEFLENAGFSRVDRVKTHLPLVAQALVATK